MTTLHTRDPVLRRKLAPRPRDPDEAPAPPPPVDGPARAIVRSFARAVSRAAPLVAEQGARQVARLTLAELLDTLDPDAFVALAQDGGGGPPALVAMDQAGFVALVEAMTIGRLSPRAAAPRRATATDAALVASVIDAALSSLEADDPAAGLQIERHVADHRLLPVLLDDTRYAQVTLSVGLVCGEVERRARLVLAVPGGALAPQATSPGGAPAEVAPAVDSGWTDALETAVMRAPASLRAELGRLTLPLSEVLDLGVGGALTLPLSALEEVRLTALDGTEQAVGRLGQSRGMRAIRLTALPSTSPGTSPLGFADARPPSTAQDEVGAGPGAQAGLGAKAPVPAARGP